MLDMSDSVTYQRILREGRAEGRIEGHAEGRIEEARWILKLLGGHRFGKLLPREEAAINAITSPEKLEHLVLKVLDAGDWFELFRHVEGGSIPQQPEPSNHA